MAKKPAITEKEARQGNMLMVAMAAVALVLALALLRRCRSENTVITIPAVSGKFEAVKPPHTPITENPIQARKGVSIGSKIEYRENSELIAKLQKENEKLKCDFEKASDSLKNVIYNQAIQLNEFSQVFEDGNITATASGIVRGEVQSLKLDYTIKERKVDVPKPKETVFRLLAGAEVGNSTSLNDFSAKGNLMFQGKKGNVLSASFDTGQRIWIGYNFSILNIKR